jgi:AcrR family transcriptional regulator
VYRLPGLVIRFNAGVKRSQEKRSKFGQFVAYKMRAPYMCRMNTKTKRRVGRPSAREKILEAAEKIVLLDGAPSLKLEEVASKAGVSKGGLFYHFPTKDDLLRGMVSRVIERSDRAEAEHAKLLQGGPNPRLRAIIAQAGQKNPDEDQLSAALLVAVANDISLLAPIRKMVEERFRTLKTEPIGFEAAAAIELAVAGLTILEALGLQPLSATDRERILRWLDELAVGSQPTR